MTIDYILTTFSPAMFGEGATTHIKIISKEEAAALISDETQVVATRPSHERLARNQFPRVAEETSRYAQLKPGVNAIHIQYRGPQVPDDGTMPAGSLVTFFLVETEDYRQGADARLL